MMFSTRTSVIVLLLGLALLLAILFRSFILDYLATPIALVLWVFWRLFRGIDQAIYWFLLIASTLVLGLVRLVHLLETPAISEPAPLLDSNATLARIHYWRDSIRLAYAITDDSNLLEQNLGRMLAESYVLGRPDATYFETYAALEAHQLPLSRPVYTFLFPADLPGTRGSFKQVLQAIWDVPRKQIRRWTGREEADYYQSLEQVIIFMESLTEQKL